MQTCINAAGTKAIQLTATQIPRLTRYMLNTADRYDKVKMKYQLKSSSILKWYQFN